MQGGQSTYIVLYRMILCYGKVVYPFIKPFHSMIHMYTVWPGGAHTPNDTNSTEMPQLNSTIGTPHGEHSSIQLLKPVGKVLVRVFGRDKAETWQDFLIFPESTVLDFQRHWLCRFAWYWDPEDRAQKDCVFRQLKLPRETCFDVNHALFHATWQASFWNMESQSISLPFKVSNLGGNCELWDCNHLHSFKRTCDSDSSDRWVCNQC